MNKPYFAKYIPTEGEIKGLTDTLTPIWNNVVGKVRMFDIKTPEKVKLFHDKMTIENYRPVKLFLCSRDLPSWKAGDVVYTDSGNIKGTLKSDYTPDKVNLVKWDVPSGNVVYKTDDQFVFKIIGEISPEATWVEEGDEFDEGEVQVGSYNTLRYISGVYKVVSFKGCTKEEIDEWEPHNGYEKCYLIKGPCGHFH